MDLIHEQNFFFQFFSKEQKFRYLLAHAYREVEEYIYKILELRDFLLTHHKRSE